MTVIEAYRSRHVIEAKAVIQHAAIGIVHVCTVDGLRVHRTRGGWRHDASAVKAAALSTATYDPRGDAIRAYIERNDLA